MDTEIKGFNSIYGDRSTLLEVKSGPGPFTTQIELVKAPCDDDEPVELNVVYTREGFYVGDLDQALHLTSLGVISEVRPRSGLKEHTCSIGFNPEEQKWYGWSHRGHCSFGIGDKVEKGDCAYEPIDIEDFNSQWLAFWDVSEDWRECETPDITCKNELVELISNTTHPDHGDQLGSLIKTKHVFRGADRDFESEYFQPYPERWGKGEWVAMTLDDAKEMAITYADSVD